MRIPTLILGYIFLSLFAVYPSFAYTVDASVCSGKPEEQCKAIAGCYYGGYGGATFCEQAPAGKYTTGNGVLYGCTKPDGASWDNDNMGNTTNDCYWKQSLNKGEIYYANKVSSSETTFQKVQCPAGMTANGTGSYTVSYTGNTGLLGFDQSCKACGTSGTCNKYIVLRNSAPSNMLSGNIQLESMYNVLYDGIGDSPYVYAESLEKKFRFTDVLVSTDDGLNDYEPYDNEQIQCQNKTGRKASLKCAFAKYVKETQTKPVSPLFPDGQVIPEHYEYIGNNFGARSEHYDVDFYNPNGGYDQHYNLYARSIGNNDTWLNDVSLAVCWMVCEESCPKGYYCDGKRFWRYNECKNGTTTNDIGKESEADCGIDNTVEFKDSKGNFKLPINDFITTRFK